ncbi:MAG: FHA domain-containing protein, partial [Myxococcota bacterium]
MATFPGTQVLIDSQGRPKVRRLKIEVKRGPDKGLSKELDAEPIRIGTSNGCEVCLSDGTVSGLHAELSRTQYGILLRDLGSTNGTFVERRRIQGVFLDGQTTVQIGGSELRVTPMRTESPIQLSPDDRFGELVGASVMMRALFAKLERIAESDTTVLITGETGTGKELAAAGIRDRSSRRKKPLV